MSERTPKSWVVMDDLAGVPSVVRVSETLMMVQIGSADPGEVEANAQFIAAAPDMERALKNAVSMLRLRGERWLYRRISRCPSQSERRIEER